MTSETPPKANSTAALPSADVLRSRASIIEAIKTPLGFFGLVLLILEGLLIILVFRAEGPDLSRLISGMLGLLVAVILIGALITYGDHSRAAAKAKFDVQESSSAHAPQPRAPGNEANASALETMPDAARIGALEAEVSELRQELDHYRGFRRPLLAMIPFAGYVSRRAILEQLGGDSDPILSLKVLSVIGELIAEGTIQMSSSGQYTRTTKS